MSETKKMTRAAKDRLALKTIDKIDTFTKEVGKLDRFDFDGHKKLVEGVGDILGRIADGAFKAGQEDQKAKGFTFNKN